ncbi:RipA family octameric membrane protein [Actinoplanes utahensis]
MRFWSSAGRYLKTTVASPDEIRPSLWTSAISDQSYTGSEEKYRNAILEQYKIYVEMADRISARRSLANSFFLTLNTLVLATVGVFWKDQPSANPLYLLIPLSALLIQCAAWFWILRFYRQLNSAKYTVIGLLEEGLPASPYWSAEWRALGEGRNPSRYWPLSHMEQWIPIMFALVYGAAFAIALVA